jgi:signal transduction histidine kinase
LTQVMGNLLSNALKFTPSGGRVAVQVTVEETRVQVDVTDTGRGLSQDEIARLFEPFSQVHAPGEIKERGTGLGLYISREILERHGGRVWAGSGGRGIGSTFSFVLPLPS